MWVMVGTVLEAVGLILLRKRAHVDVLLVGRPLLLWDYLNPSLDEAEHRVVKSAFHRADKDYVGEREGCEEGIHPRSLVILVLGMHPFLMILPDLVARQPLLLLPHFW